MDSAPRSASSPAPGADPIDGLLTIHPDVRTGSAPMGRRASRVFVLVTLLAMALLVLGGGYYVTQMATTTKNRERIDRTGTGNENAVRGFGVTDGGK